MGLGSQASAMNDSSDFDFNTYWSDPEGDCVLVSSNSAGFRLSSWELKTHSSVFREMFEGAATTPEQPIRLLDCEIERAGTIASFLLLARMNQLAMPDDLEELQAQLALVAFLEKYDCKILKKVVGEKLLLDIYKGHHGHGYNGGPHREIEHFILAAHLDNPNICRLCISLEGKNATIYTANDRGTGARAASGLDTRYLSLSYINLIPRDYYSALTQCLVKKPNADSEDVYDWERSGEEFERCLREAQGKRKTAAPFELPIVRNG